MTNLLFYFILFALLRIRWRLKYIMRLYLCKASRALLCVENLQKKNILHKESRKYKMEKVRKAAAAVKWQTDLK